MAKKYYFPFGQELIKVEQKDRSSKKVFVLGVYASAVHAKWIGKDGKEKVKALAVASEPEIFWTGENADEIISKIMIPEQLGRLTTPMNKDFNGPSGRALDEKFLKPLGLSREETWLCDLLPMSRVNNGQRKAITKHYTDDIIRQHNLSFANIPDFTKSELRIKSKERREGILHEFEESKAETLILLGDLPIKFFLHFYDERFTRLSQFGELESSYGKIHKLRINEKTYKVIPLCHPRQASRLGKSNMKWGHLHDNWINNCKLQNIIKGIL